MRFNLGGLKPDGTPGEARLDANERLQIAALTADGDNATLGNTSDAAWSGSGAGTVVAILKAIRARIPGLGQAAMSGSLPVSIALDQSAIPVDSELPAAVALSDAISNPTAPGVGSYLMGWDAVQWKRLLQINGLLRIAGGSSFTADGQTALTGFPDAAGTGRALGAAPFLYNGATFDKARTTAIIKPIAPTAVTAATGITVWTPTSAKKFRLLGWALSVTVAGEIIFGDNAVGTVIARTGLLPAAIAQQAPPNLGNGFLSAAANNVLKLDVTVSATVQGFVFGTEE